MTLRFFFFLYNAVGKVCVFDLQKVRVLLTGTYFLLKSAESALCAPGYCGEKRKLLSYGSRMLPP